METNWRYLVVEGNIGAGKTTLATMLSKELQTRLILEQFSDNPFLPAFYQDRSKYAFPLELSFLAERYQQLKDELSNPDLFNPQIIADYTILKSIIFARINLPDLEFELFGKMYKIIQESLPLPDLLVFLSSGKERLQKNIRLRGRPYEQNIEGEYLTNIQSGYFELLRSLDNIPVLVVDTTDIDFVADRKYFQKFLDLIASPVSPGITHIQF